MDGRRGGGDGDFSCAECVVDGGRVARQLTSVDLSNTKLINSLTNVRFFGRVVKAVPTEKGPCISIIFAHVELDEEAGNGVCRVTSS